MNMLEKVKSDERVSEVRKAIEGGETQTRAAAVVASGGFKKVVPVE